MWIKQSITKNLIVPANKVWHAIGNMGKLDTMLKYFILISGLILTHQVVATPKIAVLDFELDDMTYLPNTPAELARTTSFKPLLEQELTAMNYEIVQIDTQAHKQANAGVEYLFQHDDSSAELGQRFGADWIIVAKHRKPSFLYSHLIVHVIPVKTAQSFPGLLVELKGTDNKVTKKSIHFLAEKIQTLITVNQQTELKK